MPYKFIIFAMLCLFAVPGNGQSEEDSLVAISPNKDTCLTKDNFLELPDSATAEVSLDYLNQQINDRLGANCTFNGLLIKGKINKSTLGQFKLGLNLLSARRTVSTVQGNTLWLDSPGGLISESMKIGDIVAENEMRAIVIFNGRCLSSCVLILAAAKTRSGIGDIGIHRPFMVEVSAEAISYQEYLKQYERITPTLKYYFSKYGVSPAIVDAMNVIPSDNMKILSEKERETYGLGFKNIAFGEYEKARTINICGQRYYDMHINFHAAIKACREQQGKTVLDDDKCWDLAHKQYPAYSESFDICKAKKAAN